jgi:hypothetical protein
MLEVGSMSFSEAAPPGRALDSSTVVAAGVRGVREWHLTERFFLRGLVEFEGVLKPAYPLGEPSPGEVGQSLLSPRRFSFSGGIGFGGFL